VRADELERRLRERLDALGPAPRAERLHVLRLPDFDRADRIGTYWGNPKTAPSAELLIDCEEDRTLRAVLVGMLREARPGSNGLSPLEVESLASRGRPTYSHGRVLTFESRSHPVDQMQTTGTELGP
jgi:hypothetical protein